MPPIFVMGGTGHVGRCVVSQLAADGASVRALARRPEQSFFPPGVEGVTVI